jgi:hypothetical protein
MECYNFFNNNTACIRLDYCSRSRSRNGKAIDKHNKNEWNKKLTRMLIEHYHHIILQMYLLNQQYFWVVKVIFYLVLMLPLR